MSHDQRRPEDEQLLIDFLLGRCEAEQAEDVQRRLERDPELARLRDDLKASFSALSALGDLDAPEDLAERTLTRIRTERRTEALLQREQMQSRKVFWPSFSMREAGALAASVLILAAVFIPAVRTASQRSARQACLARIGEIGTAMQVYANANEGSLPIADARHRRWLPNGSAPAVSNSRGLFRLIDQNYATPGTFRCPAVGNDTFVAKAGMTDFPAADYIDYSYQHAVGWDSPNLADPELRAARENMAILADSTPIFARGTFRRDRLSAPVSDNHGRRGQNVLYMDMHGEWADTASVGVRNDNIYLAEGVYDYTGIETPRSKTDSFLLPAFSGSR